MIPEKELVLQLETSTMTLGELTIFDPDDFSIFRLIKFIRKHGNWSQKEIDAITMDELESVTKQISSALQELSVPKVTEPASSNGHSDDQPQFPSGREF